ncbi:zinc finger protein 2 [Drosophila takahashii]|uniref:zinc finger protein 2 n=1 Tax=Drosophila takahashii TaxID=29030 RepID=UPI001CF90263|nr:zinc finger protein 2 [Drosophila takahashii]
MRTCAVPNCRTRKNTALQKQVCFFAFPKRPRAFRRWLAFCGLTMDTLKTKNPIICIEHFKDEDIQGALKFEMGLAKKRTLRPGAVPCINRDKESAKERAKKERKQRRKNQKLVAKLLEESEANTTTPAPEVSCPASPVRDVDLSEVISMEFDPLMAKDEPKELEKCRICCKDFTVDSTAKNLCDQANSVLLFHIEVISGVWISLKPDEPQFMCPACVLSLNLAIDFREMCINAELRIGQNKSLAETEPDKTEDYAANEDSVSSEPYMLFEAEYTNIEKIEDPEEEPAEGDDQEPAEDSSDPTEEDQLTQEPAEESPDPAAQDPLNVALGTKILQESPDTTTQDPLSVALGAKILKGLIDQYTGNEKRSPKKEETIVKKTRIIKPAVCEQKPARKANPKTKEERNSMRRARLRAREPNFVCDQCGQAFRMAHNLRIHMLRHSRTKNYQCSECPKTFYDAYMRNMHVRIQHRGESPFACGFCSETFAYAGARQKHESEVHNAAPRLIVKRINPRPKSQKGVRHQCKLCNKHYASKYALSWHEKAHTEANTFKCQQCSRCYSDPNSLKRHVQMAHEKRPLQCDVCLKGFFQRTKLREHELIHTGERPYWCEVCNVNFRYKYNMKTHASTKMHQENLRKTGQEPLVED